MSIHTRSQKFAQAAFPLVQTRHTAMAEKQFKEYTSFAKKFPSLVHTCGLAQAVAFAEARGASKNPLEIKPHKLYLADLAQVLRSIGYTTITSDTELAKQTRDDGLAQYLRLSRDTITAASWLKRYIEAVAPEDPTEPSEVTP